MYKINTRANLQLLLIILLCLASLGIAQPAFATKSLPANVKILLGFKERYGEDNKQHYGIDVYAEKGTELYAPVEGTISFAGRVPGSAGLNVTALTITNDEGHQVSINPFATTKVKVGDAVKKGQVLGTVSDVGDPSSPESHFHLSLREKGVYKDPTHLLMETISTRDESKNAPDNTVAAGTSPTAKPPANTSTAASQAPAAQTKTQAQQSKAKSKSPGTQNVAKPAVNPKGSAVLKKESPSTAPSALEQSASAYAQEQGNAARTEVGNSADLSVAEKNASATNASEEAKTSGQQDIADAVGLSAPASLESRQANSSIVSEQGTVLSIGQSDKSSLRAEFVNFIAEMSQLQLTASMFATALLLSCAGFGAWKSVQLMGLDPARLNLRERLVAAFEGEGDED